MSTTGGPARGDSYGINTAHIPDMQKAIENYIKAINKNNNLGVTLNTIKQNVKGEQIQTSVNKLSQTVVTEVNELLATLKTLETNIGSMKALYVNQDKAAADSINTMANKISKIKS